ncbi:uncharacterized protein A1O5_07363 [Cladophialophora psammophila CBS 110553]|uniref:Uncharacterized protein n=1 Tax=Cladophialophora psammophila CBS 110553 TaxID=1182543 RepID=W9WMG0_9EURO|nr:uncharacterized protein A1O5_07363 [Cladophialophora psammophila CBS 110553]EXJ69327.1 hypothetical protein A1O5_07363 [Cladophialophora psammophila CBS 110553]
MLTWTKEEDVRGALIEIDLRQMFGREREIKECGRLAGNKEVEFDRHADLLCLTRPIWMPEKRVYLLNSSETLRVEQSHSLLPIAIGSKLFVLPEYFIHNAPPSGEIRSRLNNVFNHEISEERKTEIFGLAVNIPESFRRALRVNAREDDLVEPIIQALERMNKDNVLAVRRKADFVATLKPDFQPNAPGLGLRRHANGEADGAVDQPGKRQKASDGLPLPQVKSSSLALATTPSKGKPPCTLKTSRPDMTIGLDDSTIHNSLWKRRASKSKASDFLEALQDDGHTSLRPPRRAT